MNDLVAWTFFFFNWKIRRRKKRWQRSTRNYFWNIEYVSQSSSSSKQKRKKKILKMAQSWQNTKNTNWFTYLIIFFFIHLFCQWFFFSSSLYSLVGVFQISKKSHLYFLTKKMCLLFWLLWLAWLVRNKNSQQ